MADIGCGEGYHAVLLVAATLEYHGLVVSSAMVSTARREVPFSAR